MVVPLLSRGSCHRLAMAEVPTPWRAGVLVGGEVAPGKARISASGHAGGRPANRRLLERVDLELHCPVLCVGCVHRARDAGLWVTAARDVAPDMSGSAADGADRTARASVARHVMCRASISGTSAVMTSASGSSLIGAVEGVTWSSPYPMRAPRVMPTARSVRPYTLNHTAAWRPVPWASLRATSSAAIPAAMSPRPAGRANSAGR